MWSAQNLCFVVNRFYALFRLNGSSKPSLTSKPLLTIALKILKTIEKPLVPMVGPPKKHSMCHDLANTGGIPPRITFTGSFKTNNYNKNSLNMCMRKMTSLSVVPIASPFSCFRLHRPPQPSCPRSAQIVFLPAAPKTFRFPKFSTGCPGNQDSCIWQNELLTPSRLLHSVC